MAKTGKISSEYTVFELGELPVEHQRIINTAKQACDDAHAPYSQFHVGAAVLLDNGSVHKGSNQENAAFPSGLCAERVLLNYVHSNFPNNKPLALAIAARNKDGFTKTPVVPCGACLQVMGELEGLWETQLPVYLFGENKIIQVKGIQNFLPFFFNQSFL